MRILFVSGTDSGGAARSTRELADRMAARGHAVGMLVRHRRNDVGLGSTAGWWLIRRTWNRAWQLAERAVVRQARGPIVSSHGPMWRARHLESVDSKVIDAFAPDVIVVNSVHTRALQALRDAALRRATPVVLYLREDNAVGHIARGDVPDLVVANAHSHARAAARHGLQAVVVPSVVDVTHVQTATSRSTVLFINPIPSRGLETAIAIARLRPDLRFVFQESHRLYRGDRKVLCRLLRGIDNITVRPYTDDCASVYRDAAVLLVPYEVDNRPRVVLEAQTNGIPVVATDRPGLDECVGAGGVMVPPDAPPASWVDALARVLDDPDRYGRFVEDARKHAERSEVDPDLLTERFEAALITLVKGPALTSQ